MMTACEKMREKIENAECKARLCLQSGDNLMAAFWISASVGFQKRLENMSIEELEREAA